MENQNAALSWVIAKGHELDLSIERMTWIDDLLPGFTDTSCALTLGGRRYYGWGAGPQQDLALIKAMAECLERFAMNECGSPNSNGFAAHLSAKSASIAAAAELIERDAFLCHVLTRTPLQPFDTRVLEWTWLRGAFAWAADRRLALSFYRLGPVGIQCVIDGFGAGRPFGYVMGAAVRADEESAALSALIESARAAAYVLANDVDSLGLTAFRALPKPDFNDHGRLALDLEYARGISFLFEAVNSGMRSQPIYLGPERITTENVPINQPELYECPFHIARADAPLVQRLWVGDCTEQKVDLHRMGEFLGVPVSYSDLNHLPHPMS